jgi:hypothetical protein
VFVVGTTNRQEGKGNEGRGSFSNPVSVGASDGACSSVPLRSDTMLFTAQRCNATGGRETTTVPDALVSG